MKHRVREEEINSVTVSCRRGFLVTKPRKAPESDVWSALAEFMLAYAVLMRVFPMLKPWLEPLTGL